ncbi:MAG: hypothetical protein WC516_09970 [Patescibacteria group bacterium]|nr:hypothetical protein [Sideroxydans sp.]
MKRTWEQIYDMWNKNGVDEIFREKYEEQIKEGIKGIAEKINQEEIVRDENGEGYVRRNYLGSVFSIFPSGKFYMPWTSNQTHRDVFKDEIFREVLESALEYEDMSLENGDGDPCDLFAVKYYSDPFENFYYPEKARALASFLELEFDSWDDIQEASSNEFKVGQNKWYLVLTDEEAEDAWDESIESYIEECVLPEISKQYRCYFDDDSFKRDCKLDGRGHSLSPFDGEENEDQDPESKKYFYIYRTN